MSQRLSELRVRLSAHPYFSGVPSFDPVRGKTAVAFHAKDDLPEVRFQVFDLLVSEGNRLRFHAVVCDKLEVLKEVYARNAEATSYRYHPNELYDRLMRSLFGRLHRFADRYRVYVARRGASDRNEALRKAIIEHAGQYFERTYGFSRGGCDIWNVEVTVPERHAPLQAVDYYMWALQRFYEPRRHPQTGEETREERFLQMLWPQIGEIHDQHFGPSYGTFFSATQPLSLGNRFGGCTKKKKS
ncbi:MAG: hypothetical protein ACYC7E_18040 [Armatimonadota bacterium]